MNLRGSPLGRGGEKIWKRPAATYLASSELQGGESSVLEVRCAVPLQQQSVEGCPTPEIPQGATGCSPAAAPRALAAMLLAWNMRLPASVKHLRAATGRIVFFQEQRFRLAGDDGRGFLFTLSRGVRGGIELLEALAASGAPVRVEFEGDSNEISGVAHGLCPLPQQPAQPGKGATHGEENTGTQGPLAGRVA